MTPRFRPVRVMFSSAALRLAVDFVESLDPPPATAARPKVIDKAAAAGAFERGILEDGKIGHESARARDAPLDLSPLMREVGSNNRATFKSTDFCYVNITHLLCSAVASAVR